MNTVMHDDAAVREIMAQAEGLAATSHGISRRGFLKLTGMAGGGLILAFHIGSDSLAAARKTSSVATFKPNAFVRIAPDGSITLLSKAPEIGQGIKTALPLIIAEELDADWTHVSVEQAPINPSLYGRQSAGGSRSIPMSWDQLRRAGAVARAMLVSAAAKEWSVPETECTTAASVVTHSASGKKLTYGKLANKAATLPVPDEKTIALKDRKDYKLLGTRVRNVDSQAIVTGAPLFGIDQQVPGMLYAVYEKCPATGGKVRSANLDEVKALPGVKDVFVLEGTGKTTEVMPGVAIVATSTYAAFSARKKLKVEWDESSASKDSWTQFNQQALALSKENGKESLVDKGDVNAAFSASTSRTVEGFYTYPFISHAPLEPQNTTAWFRDGGIELWAPTQTPDSALPVLARILGIPVDKIVLHQTRIGGGFGRRLINDPVCEAALISQRIGQPVKLQWSREDDMTHDFYRVGGFHAFKGAVDDKGKLLAWQDHFITFTADGKGAASGGDLPPTEFPVPLLEHVRVTQTKLPLGTPTGPWRAPRSNAVAFAVQSFLHEMSAAAGRDHVEFLLELMGEPRWLEPKSEFALNTARAAAVIKLAAEKSGWGSALPKGRGRGIAFHFSHAGHVAEVAEVSVDANQKLTVHKITIAADVGPIINMLGAETQAQGAAIDGFSAMLAQEIAIENGRVETHNFDQYSLLRHPFAPQVEVHFIQSDYAPTGLGEPALPPAAPAICNAIFAATGERVRTLPLTKSGFTV